MIGWHDYTAGHRQRKVTVANWLELAYDNYISRGNDDKVGNYTLTTGDMDDVTHIWELMIIFMCLTPDRKDFKQGG